VIVRGSPPSARGPLTAISVSGTTLAVGVVAGARLSVRTGATSAASAAGVTAISEALNAAFLVPEPSTLLLLALALVRIGV
jgi:hypothetical protein